MNFDLFFFFFFFFPSFCFHLHSFITAQLEIPTIGIGAGADTSGQVLVFHDLLGMFEGGFQPKFAKQYASLGEQARLGVQAYVARTPKIKLKIKKNKKRKGEKQKDKVKANQIKKLIRVQGRWSRWCVGWKQKEQRN